MKERPILFSTTMVQGIIENRKTMTRRLKGLDLVNKNPDEWRFAGLGPNPDDDNDLRLHAYFNMIGTDTWTYILCPYGENGDVLWVRETWNHWGSMDGENPFVYKATDLKSTGHTWKPSIHMPKVASRIWLEITDIRVERLQDITEPDAKAEGMEKLMISGAGFKFSNFHGFEPEKASYNNGFQFIWANINGTDSWNKNPWVWVVSFKVLSTTGKPDLSTHQTNNSTL